MAVAMESFSIREYAARMRAVHYEKCWPFAEERAGRSLPPMPVRRFQWWADELRAARSGGEKPSEAGRVVDPVEKAAADVAAGTREEPVVGHGEASAEKQQVKTPPPAPPSRAKQRTPKKRSILELFAVAPPINGAQEEDRRDGGGGKERSEEPAAAKSDLGFGDGGNLLELRKRKKRVKEGGKMLKEKIGAKKKLKVKSKMMKKKKHLKVEIHAAKKEKTCRMHKKLVHNQRKSATVRTLLKKHIFRLVRTSKLVSRNQEVRRMPPIQTILKKRKRGTSTKKRKVIENMESSDLVELCCESAKHLNFSGKDDAHVHGRKCLPLQLPHFRTLCKIVSDVLAASSAMDNLNKCQYVTGGTQLKLHDGVVISNMETGETSSGKQLTDSHGHETNTHSSITKRAPLAEFDLNHPVLDCVDLNCTSSDESTLPPSPMYSGDQKVVGPMNNIGLDSDTGTCKEQSFSLTSDHINSLGNTIGQSLSVSDAKSALSFARNCDKQHWVSCLDQSSMDSTERQAHLMDPTKDVCHIPKDMLISTCSSVGSMAIAQPSPNLGRIWRDTCTEEGFIGLPLNSQGELIQLHPGNKYDFCEVDKMPNSALNSLQVLPSSSHFQPQSSNVRTKGKFPFASFYHEDDQHWFLKQYYPASKVVISDLDSTELQGLEKVKYQPHNDKARFASCDSRQMEICCCGCREHIVTENCLSRMKSHSARDLELGIRPAIQPTMRLMGKNLTVGSYNKEFHKSDDGKIWTNKEIITTSCPTTRVYNGPFLKRWHDEECILQAESGESREIPFNSLEAPSNYCCISSDNLTSNHMHLDFGSKWMLKDGNSTGSHGFRIDLPQSPVPCQSFLKNASCSAVHCTSETQSMDMGKRKTFWASYPQNFCQHMLLNSTHCKHSQSVSFGIPSTSHPPHINQVPVQTSRGLSLQKNPHWLLNTTRQQPPFIPYHPIAAYQSCTIPANSGFPCASPYAKQFISFPCGSSSISQTYDSYAPMSAVYHSSIASLTTDNFSSVSSTNGYSIKAKCGMGFNFACVKNQDRSKRCRKRPAAKDDKIMETMKRPNLKLQEDSNAPTSVRREQLHGDKSVNIGALETNVFASRKIDVSLSVMDHEKDTVVVSGGSFPSKSSHVRSGPVKLSAGAKHILRPNEGLDQENSCPIYSTVPFTQGTSSGKDADSQEKAAKVYRF